MEEMVRAEGLQKVYHSKNGDCFAVKRISITVCTGTAVAITGPSGCGKSTLLRMLGGVTPPTEGKVWIAGQDFFALKGTQKARLRNEEISFVVQDFALIESETVKKNLEIPLLLGRPMKRRGERDALIRDVLSELGLTEKEREKVCNLSGGQKQRIAIARVLIQDAGLILADEPTGALNSGMGEEIMRLLLRLVREKGRTLILVTHNPGLAGMCDKIYEMSDGEWKTEKII